MDDVKLGRAAAERERLFMNELTHDRKWMVDFITTMGWTIYQYFALYGDLASQGLIDSGEPAKLFSDLRRRCGDGLIDRFGWLTQEGRELVSYIDHAQEIMLGGRPGLGGYAAQREREIINRLAAKPHDGTMMRDLRRDLVGAQEEYHWSYIGHESSLEPSWCRSEFHSALEDLEQVGLIAAADEGECCERDFRSWEGKNLTFKGFHLTQKGEEFLSCGGDIKGKIAVAEGKYWLRQESGGKLTITFLSSCALSINEGPRRRRWQELQADQHLPDLERYHYSWVRTRALSCELSNHQREKVSEIDQKQDIRLIGKVWGANSFGEVIMKECTVLDLYG